jgi:DNA-binding transcriptional LysR family regulator
MDVALSDMLLFVSVVREGSFTAAARQLGVTKQSVSERVARLEAALGVRLLERTTRALRPTVAGSRYFERCSTIAGLVEEANVEAREQQVEPTGLLRVSAPYLYGRRFLAPVVAAYLGQHPSARVEVVLTDRRIHLVEEGFDLCVRVGPLDDSSMAARKLGEGHTYFVASPAFVAEHGRPTPETLHAFRSVATRADERWDVGGRSIPVEPVLVANDFEIACACAVAGVGVALVPSIVCRDAVEDGRLEVLFAGSAVPVHVLYPSRRQLPARVRVFVACMGALITPMRPLG